MGQRSYAFMIHQHLITLMYSYSINKRLAPVPILKQCVVICQWVFTLVNAVDVSNPGAILCITSVLLVLRVTRPSPLGQSWLAALSSGGVRVRVTRALLNQLSRPSSSFASPFINAQARTALALSGPRLDAYLIQTVNCLFCVYSIGFDYKLSLDIMEFTLREYTVVNC